MSLLLFFFVSPSFSQFTVCKEDVNQLSCPLLTVCPFGEEKKKKKSAICVRVKRFILKMTNDDGTCLDAA